jgi:hypothetical protein
MSKPDVVAPIVNINGTSINELLEQTQAAAFAVQTAYRALQLAAPHGRDYQTAPEGTYRKAREQYNIWMDQLQDIHNGLNEIGQQIWEQKR